MKRRLVLRMPLMMIALLVAANCGTDGGGADQSDQVGTTVTERQREVLVDNPGFEMDGLKGWALITVGGAVGQMERTVTAPASETNSHSLRLTVLNPGQRCGVSNQDAAGIKVESGNWFELTFRARTEKRENDRGYGLTVSLESLEHGKVFARTTIPEVGGDWQQYTVALHAYASGLGARLVITMCEPGTIWLDDISLSGRSIQTR